MVPPHTGNASLFFFFSPPRPPEALPAGSKALPAGFGALPTGSEVHPAPSEAHPAVYKTLPAPPETLHVFVAPVLFGNVHPTPTPTGPLPIGQCPITA